MQHTILETNDFVFSFSPVTWICPHIKANCFYLAVQGKVCGLCGDFDGDGQNDFTTQGQLPVSNPIDFANSWKVSSSCPDVENSTDPCVLRPNRHHWAKRMCSIITGETFKDCHSKVMMGEDCAI